MGEASVLERTLVVAGVSEGALGAEGAAHYLETARRFRAVCADITEIAPTPIPHEE